MGAHLIGRKFQSDKYPSCPAGKVPLSTKDPLAQPLLWAYAQGRRAVDAEFSDDLETALLADGYVPEPYLHPLYRGTVLRKTTHDSEEVGIVLGPSMSIVADPASPREAVEVVNGWINDPPACGIFDLPYTLMERGIWRIASEEDAARVRKLFHEHATARGPDSLAWVADAPLPGPYDWKTPPVALHWGVPQLRVQPFDPDEALRRIGRAVYDLTDAQRQGLDASAARNILTDLGGAIAEELRRAHERGAS
jgi:hypothetical protein